MLHWTRAQDDLGVRFTVQPPYSGRVAEPERGNDDARTEQVFKALAKSGQALEFIVNQHRHCKAMLAVGNGRELLERAGVATAGGKGKEVPGLLLAEPARMEAGLESFIKAIAAHRHFARESDPPTL